MDGKKFTADMWSLRTSNWIRYCRMYRIILLFIVQDILTRAYECLEYIRLAFSVTTRVISQILTRFSGLLWNQKKLQFNDIFTIAESWFEAIKRGYCSTGLRAHAAYDYDKRYHALHVQPILDDACTSGLRASRKTTAILQRTVEGRE